MGSSERVRTAIGPYWNDSDRQFNDDCWDREPTRHDDGTVARGSRTHGRSQVSDRDHVLDRFGNRDRHNLGGANGLSSSV